MTEIRLPALLDEEMRERARLHPVEARARMRLNALSTAELTMDEEDPPIRVRDMISLHGPQGFLGIFRVSALQAAGDGLRLAEMEHGLCTLEDDVTPPGTVLQGAIGDVVNTLLQWQSRPMWKLGTVESGMVLAETEADGANLLETLLAVLAIDESLMIETDQRALPWVLHLKKMPEETSCECRLNRNLDGVTVSLDGSELCTRVTAVLPDGTSVTRDGDTVHTWGVVHRAVTLDENQDPETEIPKYLEEHKNPGVSVELEAVALAALTGEALDRFSLGGLCRAALPEWNTVISQRVIAMAYDDLFGEPGRVKLTLCSQTLDASTLLARLRAEQRRSGKRMFRFIRETKNGVEILAEEILLRATKTEVAEMNGVLTDKISEVSVELDAATATLRLKANQEYVDQQFSATELLLDGANARIDANALRIDEANKQISAASLAIDGANARIDTEAKRIDEANGEISSAKLAIDGANAAITAEVTRATGAETGLAGRIKVTEDSITEQAGQISAQGKLIEGAQEQIDGINARITDFATHTEVTDLGKTVNTVSETLDAVKGEVATKVSQETFDELGNRVSDAESSITQHADEISQRVRKGDIASEINQTPQGVLISASKIDLKGYVTAETLAADIAEFKREYAGQFTTSHLFAEDGHFATLNVSGTLTADIIMGGSNVNLSIHYHNFTPNGDGTVTIGGPSATPGSFNIADTLFYQNGVSAARTAGAKSVSLDHYSTSYAPSFDPKSMTVNAFLTNDEHFSQPVDVTDVYSKGYNDGQEAAESDIDLDTVTMGWTSQNPSYETIIYTLTNGNDGKREVPSPAWGAVEVADDGITAGTYQPSIAPKSLTVNVKLTNGKGGSKALDVTDVYNKGYADGKAAASDNVTVESISDVTYNADNKNFTITIKLSNGEESKKIIDGLDAYNAGKKSVVVSDYEWSNPAKGWVRFEFTLSNDLVRGYSKEVPSKWM